LEQTPEGIDRDAIAAKIGKLFTPEQLAELYDALDYVISYGFGSIELQITNSKPSGMYVTHHVKMV